MSRSEQDVSLPGSRSEGAEAPRPIDEPLRLVHHHPGYLRIRSGAFVQPKDDDPIVAAAQTAAASAPGFRSWALNPKTGSVVVEYEPGALDADDLLKHIAKSAGIRDAENCAGGSRTSRPELVSAFLDTVQERQPGRESADG